MSVTVGVALGTILVCTVLGNKSDAIFGFFHSRCPNFLIEFGKIYHNLLGEIKDNVSKNMFLKLTVRDILSAVLWFFLLSGTLFSVSWLAMLTKSGEVGSILTAVLAFISKIICVISRSWAEELPPERVLAISSDVFQMCIWAAAFLICIPFLIGIIKSIQAIFTNLIKKSFNRRTQDELLNNRAFGVIKAIFGIAALFLFSGMFLGIASRYLPNGISVILFGTTAIILAISLWRQLSSLNNRLELAFIESFNDKIESQEQIHRKSILAKAAEKDPWPIGIHEVVIKSNHEIVGKQLSEVKLRELTGTTIIAITRGGVSTYKLGPESQFFPRDHLILMGTQQQVAEAKTVLLKEVDGALTRRDNSQFDILNFCIGNDRNFAGSILATLGLRQKYGINVVGIQRKDEKITEFAPDIELLENDILLLAGTKSSIEAFKTAFEVT
jgi:K+/H+ antiporter YhaU regulatory subunit KhtT